VIHNPIDPAELARRVEAAVPTWPERARTKTDANRAAGRHVSTDNIWSDIKAVFIAHQRRKCAYCERQLGDDGIEWDVEHYRPKGLIKVWRSPSGAARDKGGADSTGYFLLAFDIGNYMVSCKPCNSRNKAAYFPTAAKRALTTTAVAQLRTERPYLLNPLDVTETPPDTLIGFRGITPRSIADTTEGAQRAVISIELLGLTRSDLDFERAKTLMGVYNALLLEESETPAVREQSRRTIRALTGPGSPFTNCARSFVALFRSEREKADRIGVAVTQVVESHSSE
jgi:hypothetical protein